MERKCVVSTVSLNIYQYYPSFAAYIRNYDFFLHIGVPFLGNKIKDALTQEPFLPFRAEA